MTEGIAKYKLYLERRITFFRNTVASIKEKQGSDPSSRYNYHGGWELGYFEGLLAHAENSYDKLMEELDQNSN